MTRHEEARRLAAGGLDLRHTAISRWIAAGLDVAQVARRAGDTIAVVTDVYAKEFDAANRQSDVEAKLTAGTAITWRKPQTFPIPSHRTK